jgi:PAS domain S-box-containing protein
MSRWTPHAITLLGYFVSGVAGLQLGVLQGYASPLFPAAGWALAALLVFGPRVLPAVWVGAFLTNLVVEIGNGAVWTASSGALAALIAVGACLQALLGSALVRGRLGDAWRQLENDGEIIAFSVLGGPVACVVSASVGVSSLVAFGIVPGADFLFTWWNWWLGDTLGVLIGAPLSLLLLEYKQVSIWRRRVVVLAAPIVTTLVLIVAAYFYAGYWERHQIAHELEHYGAEISHQLQQRLVEPGQRSVKDIVAASLSPAMAERIRIVIRDQREKAADGTPAVLFGEMPIGDVVWQTTISGGGREWQVSYALQAAYAREMRSLLPPVIGVAGMLFISVLQLLLLAMTGRAAMVDRKVRAQTADLVQLDTQLRDRMMKLQSILDNSSVGIAFVRDRQIMLANRRMAEMFGHAPESMANRGTCDFFPTTEDYERFAVLAFPVLLRGQRYAVERQMLRADGSLVWVRMAGKLIDPSNPDAGVIWVFDDISEQKVTEAELIRAKEAAEAASVAKSQFLATMSHEIRTPMNGILGMAQLALMPDTNETDRQECLKSLLSSGQALLTLLNDILDISRVEAGKVTLENLAFDPQTVLAEVERLFRESAADKGLVISSHWQGAPATAYNGDPARLRQMLSNLVGNAVKFTHDGEIRIEAGVSTDDAGAEWLELSVLDTGIGIDPDKLEALFQPFTQADSSMTRRYGGTGLGLSIVGGLAAAMGGNVGMASEPGKGSRFWFRVPARPTAAAFSSPVVAPLPTTGRVPAAANVCVLVAEDNQTNRKVLISMLERWGYRIDLAENGQEAVDRVTNGAAPDLILMDVQMPVMGGIEATERIRDWERAAGRVALPIIALTASAYEEDRQRCLAAGMNDFLSKPVDFGALQAAMGQWLPGLAVAMAVPMVAADSGGAIPGDGVFNGPAMLLRMHGDMELARSLVALVQPDIEQRLAVLHKAVSEDHREEAVRAAHSIKGMALDIEAKALAWEAKALEGLLRDGESVGPDRIVLLDEDFARLKQRLNDWLAQTA